MRPFGYERPGSLAEAIALLDGGVAEARPLAGGTDLIIRLRDRTIAPQLVVDVKGIAEIETTLRLVDGGLRIGGRTVMTAIAADERIRADYIALAEAASVVGSVQIRNRATLAGNIANASPAADTVPSLLIYGALVTVAGPDGTRSIPIEEVVVRSGVTTIAPNELIVAIDLPTPILARGSAHLRRTRRRGHDLASVTLACSVDADGITRLAFGSVGPRPLLVVDDTGELADPGVTDETRSERLRALLGGARPSSRSMRASPEYRLAMLEVLGRRGVALARERLMGRTTA